MELNSEEIIIRKLYDGGHKKVVDKLPEESNTITVKESNNEVGKPNTNYPLKRDNCTIKRYDKLVGNTVHSEYKKFIIEADEEINRMKKTLNRISVLNNHKNLIDNIQTYKSLVNISDIVCEYESIYNVVKSIWQKDSLKSYATNVYEPKKFEINQLSQGFYRVPMLNHRKANQVIGKHLSDRGLGKYSMSWGGFIIDPEDFSKIHNTLKPFYKTPTD